MRVMLIDLTLQPEIGGEDYSFPYTDDLQFFDRAVLAMKVGQELTSEVNLAGIEFTEECGSSISTEDLPYVCWGYPSDVGSRESWKPRIGVHPEHVRRIYEDIVANGSGKEVKLIKDV